MQFYETEEVKFNKCFMCYGFVISSQHNRSRIIATPNALAPTEESGLSIQTISFISSGFYHCSWLLLECFDIVFDIRFIADYRGKDILKLA